MPAVRVSTDALAELLGSVGTAVTVVTGGAKGAKKSASILGRALRAGSRTGGRWLPRAGRLAAKTSVLGRADLPVSVSLVVIDAALGRSVGRSASRAVGGVGGAGAGLLVCGAAAALSEGLGAASCYVTVPLGSVAGSAIGGFWYDQVIGASPSSRSSRKRGR